MDSEDRFAHVLVDAQVDLNPHQVDAVLFTFNTPFPRNGMNANIKTLENTRNTKWKSLFDA
jgi:hypothetical protein